MSDDRHGTSLPSPRAGSDSPFIHVDDVSVAISGTPLLAPVTFAVPRGGSLAVRGHNGAGKSTLLRVLAGIMKPSTGTVTIDGRDVDTRNRNFRRSIAAMIGLPPFAPDLTLHDHLALVAATWYNHDADEHARSLLEELGMTGLSTRYPHEISSGQTQLFSLAVTLARPCDLLLLDEPEQRLDADRRDLVAQAIEARQRAGVTLVMATHNADLAQRLTRDSVELENDSYLGDTVPTDERSAPGTHPLPGRDE